MSRPSRLRGLGSYDLMGWVRPLGRLLERRAPRLFTAVRRRLLDLRLLLGGKLLLFAALDALLVLDAAFRTLAEGAGLNETYARVVVMPVLLLGVPALSSVLALERRAGSLDLALAVPSTVGFVARRTSSVVGLLALQSVVLLLAAFVEGPDGVGDLLRAALQSAVVLLLLPAVVVFWSVRLRSGGAVLVASAATFLALMPWIARPPAPEATPETLLGLPVWILSWGLDLSLLLAALAVFGLYARERLRRPETLLT